MPEVSVLMPVYKTPEKYLREAIESILKQTYTDFEFLILDDCPEDNREEVISSYQDSRIKYFKNEKNLGISASRNKLIALAQGKYLAVFDHDDISLPERLEKEVAYLNAHPDVGVVSSNMKTLIKKRQTNHPTDNKAIKIALMNGCCVIHTAAMIRKSVLLNNNIRYEEQFSPAEDYMLMIRLVGKTMFHNLPDVLVYYRDFAGNTSHLQSAKMEDKDAMIKCIAYKEYPYLSQQAQCLLSSIKMKKVELFGLIPLMKIKYKQQHNLYRLFGFIPFLKVKNKTR
ncbi:MAG: glycosyltransferase [Alphaproteobacteria bacterium]|nr:glycosyltransferase [Alphaproteobacteria bacterium]